MLDVKLTANTHNLTVLEQSEVMIDEDSTSSQTNPAPVTKVLTGHNSHIMSCATMNRDAGQFTDVVLVCPDGNVPAHRLVLAAASSTLRDAFLEVPANDAMPESLNQHTIVVPDIEKSVVAGFVDFLYTGKLILSRSNARDMQLLVRLLGIDPENVRVEALEENAKKRLTQTTLTSSMGLVVKQQNPVSDLRIKESANANDAHDDTKQVPLRALKRRASQESTSSNGSSKEAKTPPLALARLQSINKSPIKRITSNNLKPLKPISEIKVIKRTNKKPPSSNMSITSAFERMKRLGCHVEADWNTWLCTICRLYDPVCTDAKIDGSEDTTEWIGCDCDRWYHKICTGLTVIDDTFSCKTVNHKCLPLNKEELQHELDKTM